MNVPRIDLLTLFPGAVEAFLEAGVLGSARREAVVDVVVRDIRDFADDPQRSVDAAPYGGGDGMVLRCEPVVRAVERVLGGRLDPLVVVMSPRGRRLDTPEVDRLAAHLEDRRPLVLVAGRYAGLDERVLEVLGACELSIGDYVLMGGELPALVVVEAICRRLPGVLGNPVSPLRDSFEGGLLEHPLYTRPREFRGLAVPDVLLSGDHAAIERERRRAALELTYRRRPDLLQAVERRGELSSQDLEVLRELGWSPEASEHPAPAGRVPGGRRGGSDQA